MTGRQSGVTLLNVLIVVVVLAAVAVAVVALLNMDPTGVRAPRTGTRYVEGVRDSAPIDPLLIEWEESAAPLDAAMESPCALAVDAQDRIWVIGDRLVILTAAGERLTAADLEGDYRAVAADGRGRIVAAACDRVDFLEVEGTEPAITRSVPFADDGTRLDAVALSAESVFVADAGLRRVCRLPLEEGGDAAPFEVVADGFFVPSTMDLTVSPEGELTTVDPGRHTVQVRDGYGDVVRSFGQRGDEVADFHGCCNPIAIAVTRDGLIVTAEKGLATTRVKVYDADGELDSVVAGPDSFDDRPDGPPIVLDVAVDSRGRVLALDPARRQVRVFTRIE